MKPRNYILTTALSFLGLSLMVVLFNWLVDPYLITDNSRVPGFNAYKTQVNEHVRLSKAYHPLQNTWNALVVGNSRVEMGINPANECFINQGIQAYNLGIPGAGLRKQLEMALNVIYQQPIEYVFLGLDFVDFFVRPRGSPVDSNSDWDRPTGNLRHTFSGGNNPEYFQTRLYDYYRTLYSLDALSDSISTVLTQSANGPDRDQNGFNPARDMAHATKVEGAYALFAQKYETIEKEYSQDWGFEYSDGTPAPQFAVLKMFLEIAAEKGVRVVLFAAPYHEQFWSIGQNHNMRNLYEGWLRKINKTLTAAPNTQTILWDFASDSDYIHEQIPAPGVKGEPLAWFWEASHYREGLGDLMIQTVLKATCQSKPVF